MVDKKAVDNMYEDAEVFQSSILEARQADHAAEVMAAEERARAHRKQKKVRLQWGFGRHGRLGDLGGTFLVLHARG